MQVDLVRDTGGGLDLTMAEQALEMACREHAPACEHCFHQRLTNGRTTLGMCDLSLA